MTDTTTVLSNGQIVQSDLTNCAQVIQNLATQAKNAAIQYGPDAYQLALKYVHVMAVINSVYNIIIMILSAIIFGVGVKIFNKAIKNYKLDKEQYQRTCRSNEETYMPWFGLGIVICGLFSIFFTVNLMSLISQDNLMGLFYPQVELMHQVVSMATNAAASSASSN